MEKYLQQLLRDIGYATENVSSPYYDEPTNIWDWISDEAEDKIAPRIPCLLYTSPSPRDRTRSRMPSSA